MTDQNIADLLAKADDAYYNTGSPIMSDAEYDALRESVGMADTVQGAPVRGIKIVHRRPMKSLAKVHTVEEVVAFIDRVNQEVGGLEDIDVQLKYDGLAVTLWYDEEGCLVDALKRGNHHQGESVLHVIRRMKGIPLTVPTSLRISEIRGEVMVSKTDFEEYCRNHDDEDVANPRNLAAGIVNRIDSPDDGVAALSFVAYDVLVRTFKEDGYEWAPTPESVFSTLTDKDQFTVSQSILSSTNTDGVKVGDFGLPECEELIRAGELAMADSPWDCDGIVLKVHSGLGRHAMGDGDYYPHWAVAFKYPDPVKPTVLREIRWNVSKNGRCVPVAHFDTVYFDTKVSKCTMNNVAFLEEAGVRIGDTILVTKANKIIPKFMGVIEKANDGVEWTIPEGASRKGRDLVIDEESDHRTISHMLAGFRTFNILGIGYSYVADLYHYFRSMEIPIRDFVDLVTVPTEDDVRTATTEHRAQMFLDAFQTVLSTTSLHYWLVAMDIPDIGSRMCTKLCRNFRTWNDLINATYYDLVSIDGIGGSTAITIIQQQPTMQSWYDRLTPYINEFTNPFYDDGSSPVEQDITLPLSGKTVLVTGSVEGYTRDTIADLVTSLGATYASSVSKNLDLLVIGAKPGDAKVIKAETLGIETISAEDFVATYVG